MRLLAISDIHNNLACVRKLRHQETNGFDGIICAGDIGEKIAPAFFMVLKTFNCPIFYVHGNWDYKLDYAHSFSSDCLLIHLNVLRLGPLWITGFSGCPTKWGNNPIWLEQIALAKERHPSLISLIKAVTHEIEEARKQLEIAHETALAELEAKNLDRRRTTYRQRLERLHSKRHRAIEIARRPLDKLSKTKDYLRYQQDLDIAWRNTLSLHREAVVNLVKEENINPANTIVVTHERLYRLHEDVPALRCHLFGHRHGFKHTLHKGFHNINVSVLDAIRPAVPNDGKRKHHDEQWRLLNAGTYTVIDIDGANLTVKSESLDLHRERWQTMEPLIADIPWIPEEQEFTQGLDYRGSPIQDPRSADRADPG